MLGRALSFWVGLIRGVVVGAEEFAAAWSSVVPKVVGWRAEWLCAVMGGSAKLCVMCGVVLVVHLCGRCVCAYSVWCSECRLQELVLRVE